MISWNRSLQIVGDGNTSTTVLVRHLLRGTSTWRGRQIHVDETIKFSLEEVESQNDALFLIRYCDPKGLSDIKLLIERGIPYAYLIDDNFWLLLDDSPLSKFYKDWSVRRTLEAAISGANVVLCHSRKFRDFLRRYNANVVVVPAFFDASCIQNMVPLDCHGERRIGVVGNPSKAGDLDIIVPAVLSVAERAGEDVFFEFFGYVPPKLSGHPKVRSFAPIADYPTFLRAQFQRNWITALAPLRENRFSSYKSNNKYREFGGCAIAGIYSDVDVYRESVSHGHNGWLVANEPAAWARQIEIALSDPDESKRIGMNAQKNVLQHYSLVHVRKLWISAVWSAVSKAGAKRWAGSFRRSVPRSNVQSGDLFISTNSGWVGNSPSTARAGFYEGEVLFSIAPGESVQAGIEAPVSGEFHWNMVVATFMKTLSGMLTIEVLAEGRAIHAIRLNGPEIVDNQAIPIDLNLEEGQQLTINVRNELEEAIGLYLLSPNGMTTYASTGRFYAGRFVA